MDRARNFKAHHELKCLQEMTRACRYVTQLVVGEYGFVNDIYGGTTTMLMMAVQFKGKTVLEQYLAREKRLPMHLIKRFGVQLGDIIEKLQGRVIVHRNINLQNLELTSQKIEDAELRLKGFEYAIHRPNPEHSRHFDGPNNDGYDAPEVQQTNDYHVKGMLTIDNI